MAWCRLPIPWHGSDPSATWNRNRRLAGNERRGLTISRQKSVDDLSRGFPGLADVRCDHDSDVARRSDHDADETEAARSIMTAAAV